MRTTSRAVGLLVASLLFAGPASATTVRYAPLAERVRVSDWIVDARVRSVDPAGPFRTCYRLELLETIRGSHETKTLELTVPGGRDGPRVMRIPGMPRLRTGERVVLLLQRTPVGELTFTGLGLGVFSVDPADGSIRQELFGARVTGAAETISPATSLDALLIELRELAR